MSKQKRPNLPSRTSLTKGCKNGQVVAEAKFLGHIHNYVRRFLAKIQLLEAWYQLLRIMPPWNNWGQKSSPHPQAARLSLIAPVRAGLRATVSSSNLGQRILVYPRFPSLYFWLEPLLPLGHTWLIPYNGNFLTCQAIHEGWFSGIGNTDYHGTQGFDEFLFPSDAPIYQP